MRERLQARLEELKAEYGKGQTTLEELEAKISSVRTTMLRISGAIQVLEEELRHAGASPVRAVEESVSPEVSPGKESPAPSLNVSA